MHPRPRLHRPAALLASVLFVLACEPNTSTQPPAEPAPAPALDPAAQELEARLAYLEQQLEQAREEGHVPGMAIAIVKDDQLIYAHGFGVSDIEQGTPVSPQTTFAIGSSTKAFSSALAAMMVDEGKLAWDDPISKHLPELELQIDAPEGEQATVRDLLSHRSGFARMGVLWAANTVGREEVLRYASKAKPVAPFRAEFHYNNVTYMAGAMAAARAAGSSWEELVQARLLEPLGMSHSSVDYASAQADPNYSKGYTWREDLGEFELAPMRQIDLIGPAGSINSSVLDMANWLRFQLAEGEFEGQRLVSAEALAETRTKQIEVAPGSVDYGMGWMLREWEGRTVVEHGGNIDGFAASVALLPEEQLGMVLLTNVGFTPLQGTAMTEVWEALLTDAYLPPEVGEGGEDFSAFVGEYISTIPGMKENFSVEQKDGKLAVDVPGQMLYTLEPPDEDGWRYFEATDEVAVSFDTNEAGEVIALRLHQGGMSFELLREGVVLPPEVEASEVRELLGSYRAESGMSATVMISNGRLAVDIPGQMVYELELPDAQGDYHFRVSYDFVASFKPGESLTIIQPGATNIFTRDQDATPAATISLEQLHTKRKSAKRQAAFAKAGVIHWSAQLELINAGASGTSERWSDPSGQLREEMSLGPLGEGMSVVTSEGGFSESSFEPARKLQGVELLQSRLGVPQALFGDWREYYDSEELLRTMTRDGQELHVIELRKEGLPPREIYVDAKTWDVVEIHSVELSSKGLRIPTTTKLSDYRKVQGTGVRVPFRTETSNPYNGTAVVTLSEVEAKVAEDPQRFALPEG